MGTATDGTNYNFSDNQGTTDVNSPLLNLIDISGTGTEILSGEDDEMVQNIPIGFTFRYFGADYTEVSISSNGRVSFNASENIDDCCSGEAIPTAGGMADNFAALFWTDDDLSEGGHLFYETQGTAPNRKFIVYYAKEALNCCIGYPPGIDAELVLYETTNLIEYHYANADITGQLDDAVSAGIENLDGSAGLQYFFIPSTGGGGDSASLPPELVTPTPTTFQNVAVRFSDGTCGNTFVDGPQGETCDDGNTVDGDGCDSKCQKEIVQQPQQPQQPTPPAATPPTTPPAATPFVTQGTGSCGKSSLVDGSSPGSVSGMMLLMTPLFAQWGLRRKKK